MVVGDAGVPKGVARKRRWLSCVALATVLLGAASVQAAQSARALSSPGQTGKLHIASPDWRDQIIYFVMTDRFDDGDPGNNDQGAHEFNPQSNASYSGGDLKGLLRRVDYIQGLGATAVWLTPPVANQWWDPASRYAGYHGYWAENFRNVDAHLGTLADYQALSRRLHGAGMYLVQDIVLNHNGNFLEYDGPWDPHAVDRNFKLHASSTGITAPSQWPFSMNDARKPSDRRAAVYHWTPNIADYTNHNEELNFQMSGLDDLNSENPLVRRALRSSYGYWIRAAGVDAFRVDTAFYVPQQAIADFLYASDKSAPGVMQVARQTGRNNFFVFGEGFGVDKPFEDLQARKMESYVRTDRGLPVMQGMLNFPLYGSGGDVFARGRPTAELGFRIRNLLQTHSRPQLMPSFVDNHDVDRFLLGSDAVALQQNLALIMTLPGVPVVYYGTEQGFTEQRASMFKAGYGSGGVDHFDTQAPLYQFIQRVTRLRRDHRVFSRGTPLVLRDSAVGPGPLAYRMDDGNSQALVVFNTALSENLLDNLPTGMAAGARLQGVFSLDGVPPAQVVGMDGCITLRLPPRSVSVWMLDGSPRSKADMATSLRPSAGLALAAMAVDTAAGAVTLSGQATSADPLRVVVDGDLASAQTVHPDVEGRWQSTLNTEDMVDPAVSHRVVLWSEQHGQASPAQTFQVVRPWTELADVLDPVGDDSGPRGNYRYPTDAGWGVHHQLDLRRVKVSRSGGSLKLDLSMAQLTTSWNPPNGFDHVAITAFVQLPGREDGVRVMPLQNANLPDGMQWHYRIRVHGWSKALFCAQGASADHEGTAVAPAADVRVDHANNTISLVLTASALGHPVTLSGAKVYVTTWDYDGGYRALQPDANGGAFGGGHAGDPLVMDDSVVIVLP